MVIPFLGVIGVPGSSLFPPPEFPNNVLIWIYVAYMFLGGAWFSDCGNRGPTSSMRCSRIRSQRERCAAEQRKTPTRHKPEFHKEIMK